jgi:hypothetical protein
MHQKQPLQMDFRFSLAHKGFIYTVSRWWIRCRIETSGDGSATVYSTLHVLKLIQKQANWKATIFFNAVKCGTISVLCPFLRSRDGILGILISVQSAVDNSGHVPPVHILISIITEERGVSASGLRAQSLTSSLSSILYTVQCTVCIL